ncbi:ROK family protein [Rathayibacter soli]|uniref:ROK family protein n=1 Tax=Rathayibacter soli TaxID=3144168 RepID=UPI0027E43152|nr:ROK family protein [Glaciibacter superstes]
MNETDRTRPGGANPGSANPDGTAPGSAHPDGTASRSAAGDRAPLSADRSILGAGDAVLAFDVGGTDMKAALINEAGELVEVVRVRTPLDGANTAENVVAEAGRLAREFATRHPQLTPVAAGLLVPGEVDDDAGVGVFAENLGWRDMPFRDRLSEILGIPVSFSHDVRGAGEAEYRLGAAAGFSDVVVMVIGTGIASALFVQGRLYSGHGMAGEIGHSKIADGPVCACGGTGCLEAVASAGAIARRYNALTGRNLPGAREVLDRAAAGDADAQAIWSSALDALALGLSHTVALLAPEAIVIGGGLAAAGDTLFVPLRERLDAILTFHRRPLLIPASIGQNAGLIGAALKARDLMTTAPAPDSAPTKALVP